MEEPLEPPLVQPVAVLSDSDMESPPESPKVVKGKKKPASNFATLDSLQQDDSSSDEEEGKFTCFHTISNL